MRHIHPGIHGDEPCEVPHEPVSYLAAIAQGLVLAALLVVAYWIVWVIGG